ncbi:sulfotransferase family protein [Stakelama tenebrarum]|uniref:Sulfotransferase n=1 Tax=Stakelama tenebrarum TaxID=2711215 RepID=A0A6G6Y7B5_9SPHN|nr:sulfotransferase [Sphingosinithalassobacter tenebrarum]QIG80834.1 sulfotransferase [Sphingosinithalassobacter tenebrarum]
MTAQLNADALVTQAMQATGLEKFDSNSWREGLDIYVADVNAAGLSEQGVGRLQANLVELLANRLKVADYLRQRPELLERPVEKPVFVFGIPRTGTTLLSNLLACDPARRSPLTWEIDNPVPPATSDTLKTDPRAVVALEREKAMLAARPEMGKYYRNSAVYPNECIFFMAHDFKALALESRGKLPNYRDWLFSTDMTSAYQYHKKFLQLLQADAPGTWSLKMPSHALWLDTIKTIYPDARLVWTHRDPFTATGSFCSIISLAHMGFMGRVDTDWLRENCTYQAVEHAERIMNYRDAHGEDSMVDVHYADLTDDPLGAMRKLYAALGDEFTPEAEAAMQAWLDDNPQNKFGKHAYKLDQYGLTVEDLAPKFERYLSRYDVAREG